MAISESPIGGQAICWEGHTFIEIYFDSKEQSSILVFEVGPEGLEGLEAGTTLALSVTHPEPGDVLVTDVQFVRNGRWARPIADLHRPDIQHVILAIKQASAAAMRPRFACLRLPARQP
jgi:hypothetical protein